MLSPVQKPVFRRLRSFAFDPGLTSQLETTVMNEVVLKIPWETDAAGNDTLKPGPVGEYVEVVDPGFDPVDLDRAELLAHDGLPPSDGNPQFRQQMLYAVAMRTIGVFESALGRKVHWAPNGAKYRRQMQLLPHFENTANAYYDQRGKLCFGYFEAVPDSPLPGMAVFTSLSQDVVAHELTHALLHGMHIEWTDDANGSTETLAFHEGFADLVALFLHFSLPEVVRHQVALSRGDLTAQTQLGVLASQFGQALGQQGGLRSAFGELDANRKWVTRQPNPKDYLENGKYQEPHARGSLLVRAIFDAFNKIYESRVSDLIRIATHGSGLLPEGRLHPDLVNRLAAEAAKSARHVLDMCIRALDYCPLVNVTFGDYLRAIITADYDLVPTDDYRYRVAFLESFLRHGMFPPEVATLSVETLLWPAPTGDPEKQVVANLVRGLAGQYSTWNRPLDREQIYRFMESTAQSIKKEISRRKKELRGLLGPIDPAKSFDVRFVWPRKRVDTTGQELSQWVIGIVQTTNQKQAACTLLVDADSGLVRYSIQKTGGRGNKKVKAPTIDLLKRSSSVTVPPPHERRLRVFAFDPSLALEWDTARMNEVVLHVPWESLGKGPVGEYLEVVDRDPASKCFYEPVDLNHSYLLAQDGLVPSENNPQFHQQMVYAVAMRTIRNFEKALGRIALWSPRRDESEEGSEKVLQEQFVRRLRLYPHALREANAFYSPSKKAILFGYFPAALAEGEVPVSVFTSLSHDIIAHEVTHALLDGMHRRFAEASNPDVPAFHEAFSDLVALLQHFSIPEVLEHQIAATRGDLTSQNRLGELAQQFGTAIGNHGALRSAIGEWDTQTGKWKPLAPNPDSYLREFEPHARGALLVAAVFDGFLTIYRTRIADLLRIATSGSGVLPEGNLHPDLVSRLASEAAKTAQRVLEMCIRALDYLAPVDITFGDYLRALITADFEFDPEDRDNRRVAIIEAFRRRGILPDDVRTLSVEGLLWKQGAPDADERIVINFLSEWMKKIRFWNLSRNRQELFERMRAMRAELHNYFVAHGKQSKLAGFDSTLPFEVHSVRPSSRVDLQGKSHFQWVIEITQRIPEYLDEKEKKGKPDYYFRGGSTLLVDAVTGRVRYSIRKRIDSNMRREKQRKYMSDVADQSLYATYFRNSREQEPFAALHRF
jgi:hypothetical protein